MKATLAKLVVSAALIAFTCSYICAVQVANITVRNGVLAIPLSVYVDPANVAAVLLLSTLCFIAARLAVETEVDPHERRAVGAAAALGTLTAVFTSALTSCYIVYTVYGYTSIFLLFWLIITQFPVIVAVSLALLDVAKELERAVS